MEIQVPALTQTPTICMTFGQMAAAWLLSSVSEMDNINKLGIPRAYLFLPTAFKRGSRQLYWEIMQEVRRSGHMSPTSWLHSQQQSPLTRLGRSWIQWASNFLLPFCLRCSDTKYHWLFVKAPILRKIRHI